MYIYDNIFYLKYYKVSEWSLEILFDSLWLVMYIYDNIFILMTVAKDTYSIFCVSMKRVSTKGTTFGRNKRNILERLH